MLRATLVGAAFLMRRKPCCVAACFECHLPFRCVPLYITPAFSLFCG